jgi:hypothetical protein
MPSSSHRRNIIRAHFQNTRIRHNPLRESSDLNLILFRAFPCLTVSLSLTLGCVVLKEAAKSIIAPKNLISDIMASSVFFTITPVVLYSVSYCFLDVVAIQGYQPRYEDQELLKYALRFIKFIGTTFFVLSYSFGFEDKYISYTPMAVMGFFIHVFTPHLFYPTSPYLAEPHFIVTSNHGLQTPLLTHNEATSPEPLAISDLCSTVIKELIEMDLQGNEAEELMELQQEFDIFVNKNKCLISQGVLKEAIYVKDDTQRAFFYSKEAFANYIQRTQNPLNLFTNVPFTQDQKKWIADFFQSNTNNQIAGIALEKRKEISKFIHEMRLKLLNFAERVQCNEVSPNRNLSDSYNKLLSYYH